MERNADGSLKIIARLNDDWLHEGTEEFRNAREELARKLHRFPTNEEVEEFMRAT